MATSPLSNLLTNDFWGTPLSHTGSHKSYRPLCSLTFKLNAIWSGLNPYGFHLVNVLLHCIATFLFVALARTHFPKSKLKVIVSSLAFALHPIHTEAVAGIVGRADILAAIFFMAALLSFDVHMKTKQDKNETKRPFLAFTVCCATMAMFCKEQGITVLGVCLLKCLGHRKSRDKVTLFWLVSAIFGLLVLRGQLMGFRPPKFAKADNPASASDSILTRFLTLAFLPAFNFWLVICPTQLSFDWSMDAIPLIKSLWDPRNGLSAAFYSGLLVLAWKRRKVRDTKKLLDIF